MYLIKDKITWKKCLYYVFSILIFNFPFFIYSENRPEKYYVNKEYILRAKSFESNKDKVDIVYPGDIVELQYLEEKLSATKKEDEFIAKVQFGTKIGFIPFKFIQKTPPKNISKIRKRAIVQPGTYFVGVKSLAVRMEANEKENVVFSIPKNSEVSVIRFSENDEIINGIPGKWAFISYGRSEGWVFSGYLKEEKTIEETEVPDRITQGKTYYVINADQVLKDEPSIYGTPIIGLEVGDEIEVLDKKKYIDTIGGSKSNWVKAKINDSEGWIFGAFISQKKPEQPSKVISEKTFIYPLEFNNSKMTSTFGPRIDPVTGKTGANHTGVDLYPFRRFGAPIYCAGDGYVLHQSSNSGYGNLTVVQHPNGLVTYYAHQQKFSVKQNDKIKAGDLIGEVGSSGKSTGPHLHFEVRTGLWQEQLNPEKFITVPGK